MQPITNLSEGTGYAGAYQHIYLILNLFTDVVFREKWSFFHYKIANNAKQFTFQKDALQHDMRPEPRNAV